MISMHIGRDHKGTLSGVAFDGTPGGSGATVAWALYDATNTLITSGTGSFVSSGTYSYTISASSFASQAPAVGSNFRLGRVYVTVTQGGVSGSFGDTVSFEYPQPTAT